MSPGGRKLLDALSLAAEAAVEREARCREYNTNLTDPALSDSDCDGATDTEDDCPFDASRQELGYGSCGCGQPDIDTDNDGIFNCHDMD